MRNFFIDFDDSSDDDRITPRDIFYNPSLKETKIDEKRRGEKRLMKADKYQEYVARPSVEIDYGRRRVPEKQAAFADMSREMMSSSRCLPSFPLKFKDKFPQDASKINRTKFLKKDPEHRIWWFNANYSKENLTFKFIVKEIDLCDTHGDHDQDFHRHGDHRYYGCTSLMKELYFLHYFKHENLLHAYFTRCEPNLYRMNIALPRTIPLLKISTTLSLQYHWQNCPSMPYVAICILRALAYLHIRSLAHGNVCIENCSLDPDGNVVLGGFGNVQICEDLEGKEYDIWNVGTTILDFVLGTTEHGIDFPDPTCIRGYDSLVDKMLNVPSEPRVNNNTPPPPDERFQNIRLGYIHTLIPRDSQLFQFLDRIFHARFRPGARYFLEHYPYTAVEDEQFEGLKHALRQKCLRYDDLKPTPLCHDRRASSVLQSINPRNVSNVFKSKKLKYGDIPCSAYQSLIKNPSRKIKDGTEVYMQFSLFSEIFNPPEQFDETFVVGSEQTLYQFLTTSLDHFEEEVASIYNRDSYWDKLNCPGQFFFPWDIFRLRTAVDSLLSDAANNVGNTRIIGNELVAKRRFVLCNNEEKDAREVEIVIKCPSDSVVCIRK